MKPVWYTKKGWVIVFHALAWIGLFSLPFLLRPYNEKDPSRNHVYTLIEIAGYILSNGLYILYFYTNAYLFIPQLLSKNKYGRYVFMLLLSFVVIVILEASVFVWLQQKAHFDLRNHVFFHFFIFLFFSATSLAYRLISDKTKMDRLSKEKENENLKTELSLLRSQASPHFMFNVLNNMVALARKKSDLLEPSLIKLSSLIRYTVYEAAEETVPLDKEIEYLESYIDLQRQRFGSNVQFNISFDALNSHYDIEPMLLIPFVENAIKHGTGFIEHAQIDIHLKVTGGVLHFLVRNRYDGAAVQVKDKTSGIGLANVQRRLNLLYGNKHILDVEKKDGWFTVSLEIHLHS